MTAAVLPTTRPLGPGLVLHDGYRDLDHAVATVFDGLGPRSRRRRFLSAVPALSPSLRRALVDGVDGERHRCLVVTDDDVPVALARVLELTEPGTAEVALEIVDHWQGRGLGSRLAVLGRDCLRDWGYDVATATTLASNTPARRVFGKLVDLRVESTPPAMGCVELRGTLPPVG